MRLKPCCARGLQVLFPPLTYLQPTGRVQIITVGEDNFKVVEVTPNIP